MNTNIYKLQVSKTFCEIDNVAKSVYFDIAAENYDVFQWVPGQHLTVIFNLHGKEVRRSYSISSSPYSNDGLRITVKRVKGGVVSNYINDHINAGDIIDVMPPFGGFQLQVNKKNRRSYYFYAAGSGITPMYAMLNSVLLREPDSFVYLIYGNKSAQSIIFKNALEKLQQKYLDRIVVAHVFSNPSMWSGFHYWRKGIIDSSAVEAIINEYPPYAQDVQYYICGPNGMNICVKQALKSIDVPTSRIHMESYGAETLNIEKDVEGLVVSELQLVINKQQHKVRVKKGQTVLSAVREAGLKPPFSCESGVCGACKAHMSIGQVHMNATMALTEAEVLTGQILTCQSLPTSDKLVIDYDK